MVALAESDDSFGIVSSYRLKGNRILGEGLPYAQSALTGSEVCRLQLTTSLFVFGTPTTLLYRSEIVRHNSPFYDERTFFDDADLCYRILQSWNFGFVHQVLSFSRVDDKSIRGRIIDFNLDILDKFLQAYKFGPAFLQKKELDPLLYKMKADYYRFLARSLLVERSGIFWRFHKSSLKSGGLRLETPLLAKHVCLELARHLTNPGSTFKGLYDWLCPSRKVSRLRTKHRESPRTRTH
jgi:hypothetical protein